MIDATLVLVPPGGGEADYQLPFRLPRCRDLATTSSSDECRKSLQRWATKRS